MSLMPYNLRFGSALDRWFDDPRWDRDLATSSRALSPSVEVRTDEEGVVLRLEVPGIPTEDLHVETRDHTLVIEAKPSEGEGAWRHGGFQRALRLSKDVDLERAEAGYEHGVLTIRIPMHEATKPREIEVKVH